MIVYLVLLFTTVSAVYYTEKILINEKKVKMALVLTCLTMIILGTVRSINVGNDLGSYFEYFTSDYYYKIEPGYVALSRLIYNLGLDFRMMMFISQCLIVAPVIYCIIRFSENKWLSLFLYQTLYLFANSFNIVRQSIAMSICLLVYCFAIHFINNRKKSRTIYISGVLIAATFHVSALIILPLFLTIKHTIISKKNMFILAISFVLVFLLHNQLLEVVISLFNREYYSSLKIEFGPTTVAIVVTFIFIVFYLRDKTDNENVFITSTINISLIAFLVSTLGIWFPNHARLIMYYYLFMVVCVPTSVGNDFNRYNKYQKIIYLSFIVLMIGFYLLQLGYSDYGGVVPYGI